MQNRTISVAALVIMSGETLLSVRKRDTTSFILPGGKLEQGESAAQAAVREVHEELGLRVSPQELSLLGRFRAAAANEADRMVSSSVYVFSDLRRSIDPALVAAAAEIEELAWMPLRSLPADTARRQLAPLTREHVVPALLGVLEART